MEPPYDKLPGVISTTSGYTGGNVANPTYEQVSAGGTGHAEAVLVRYDPARVSYATLLEVFWHNIDPVDGRPPVLRCRQRSTAARSSTATPSSSAWPRRASAGLKHPAVSSARSRPRSSPPSTFYPAEAYHQDYYTKNPVRYKFYRWSCGRDQRLQEIWGPPK